MPSRTRRFRRGLYRFINREVLHRHLPHRPRGAARSSARAARCGRPDRRSSSSACPTRPASATSPSRQVIPVRYQGRWAVRPPDVPQRPPADRRRPRDLGLPQRSWPGPSSASKRHAGRALITARSGRHGNDGLAKHRTLDHREGPGLPQAPNWLLKIIPHVDCTPRICELVATTSRT